MKTLLAFLLFRCEIEIVVGTTQATETQNIYIIKNAYEE